MNLPLWRHLPWVCFGFLFSSLAWAEPSSQIRVVPQMTRSAGNTALEHDGQYSVRWESGSEFTLWDHKAGLLLGGWDFVEGGVNQGSLAPGGRFFITTGRQHPILLDLDGGPSRYVPTDYEALQSAQFSLDGSKVLLALQKKNEPFPVLEHWDLSPLRKLGEVSATWLSGNEILSREDIVPRASGGFYLVQKNLVSRFTDECQKVEEIADLTLEPGERLGSFRVSDDDKRAVSLVFFSKEAGMGARLSYLDWERRKPIGQVVTFEGVNLMFRLATVDLALSRDGRLVATRRLAQPSDEGQLLVYDFGSTKPRYTLKSQADPIGFSRDGARLIAGVETRASGTGDLLWPVPEEVGSYDEGLALTEHFAFVGAGDELSVWDLDELRLAWSKKLEGENDIKLRLSPDEKHVAVFRQKQVEIYDAKTGERRATDIPESSWVDSIEDVRFIDDQTIQITRTGPIGDGDRPERSPKVSTLALGQDKAKSSPRKLKAFGKWWSAYSFDGNQFAVVDAAKKTTLEVQDLSTGRKLREHPVSSENEIVVNVAATAFGFLTHASGVVRLFSEQREAIATFGKRGNDQHIATSVSSDGKRVGLAHIDGTYDVVDAKTGKVLDHFDLGRSQFPQAAAVSPTGRFLISMAEGKPRLINLRTKKWIYLLNRGGKWVAVAEDGRFSAARDGSDALAMTLGRQGFRIDQVALHKNDPASLLEDLGTGSEGLKAVLKAQFLKRLRKAGLSEPLKDPFSSAPEVRDLEVAIEKRLATVRAKLTSSAGLSGYQIFVNGVPLHPGTGQTIRGQSATISALVELGNGDNKIEVQAYDTRGVGSPRAVSSVRTQGVTHGDLYFVAFGVSKYKKPEYNLKFAGKDVLDLEAYFASLKARGQTVHTRVFVDEAVVPAALTEARKLLARTKIDDTVVLMIAGHGIHSPGAEATYYFVGHETDVSKLSETGIPFSEMEGLLREGKSRKKLLLMDTCESGELDPLQGARGKMPGETAGLLARGFTLKQESSGAGKTAPLPERIDENLFVFNDLRRSTGAIVLSSSQGHEFSYERTELKNGVFTEMLLRTLTDSASGPEVSTRDLQSALATRVARATGGRQNPTIDRDNISAGVTLPTNPAASALANRTAYAREEYLRATTLRRESPPESPAAQAPPPPLGERPGGCMWTRSSSKIFLPIFMLAGAVGCARSRRRSAAKN